VTICFNSTIRYMHSLTIDISQNVGVEERLFFWFRLVFSDIHLREVTGRLLNLEIRIDSMLSIYINGFRWVQMIDSSLFAAYCCSSHLPWLRNLHCFLFASTTANRILLVPWSMIRTLRTFRRSEGTPHSRKESYQWFHWIALFWLSAIRFPINIIMLFQPAKLSSALQSETMYLSLNN
jgi:hypothetical protein